MAFEPALNVRKRQRHVDVKCLINNYELWVRLQYFPKV